jgi:hypothetical protein
MEQLKLSMLSYEMKKKNKRGRGSSTLKKFNVKRGRTNILPMTTSDVRAARIVKVNNF